MGCRQRHPQEAKVVVSLYLLAVLSRKGRVAAVDDNRRN